MTDLKVDYVKRYLELKRAGKLGVIWADAGVLYYQMPGEMPARASAGFISHETFMDMVDYWYPRGGMPEAEVQRFPMGTSSYSWHRVKRFA